MHVNVERLLRETPLSVEPSSLDAVHQRLFGPAKRRAPDHYEIHEELGRGGYGRVYRSIDKRYPREVALKVIPYHGARQLARLEREARALAGLAHPNIVTVFDKGIADAGVYFLATERVAGTRLDAWMHDPARRLAEIIEIFAQAAEGLQHAHQRGMVHRDFKPSNAIVDQDGRLRILDFGLVELVEAGEVKTADENEMVPDGGDTLTGSASLSDPTRSSDWSHGDGAASQNGDGSRVPGFRGTPAYASPEQLEGHAVDSRSDQFSLCVALFEACHGFRPFSGRTVLELSEQMTARALARGAARHRIPRWLERLLRRGLSPNPAERYENVGEIAAILRAHLRPKPWLAMAATVVLTLGLVGSVVAATRPPTIDLDWEGAWPEGVDEGWVEASYGPGLRQSLETYESDWKVARDDYADDPEREADGAVVQCLDAAKQRFHDFVEGLQEPSARLVPPSISDERIMLAHFAKPGDCLLDEPPLVVSDALAEQLVDAQSARLAGRYDEALGRLASLRDEPVLQHGLASGLFNYELGLVQLHTRDPAAWLTLANAAYDAGDDQVLRVEAMEKQLEAGVTLQAADGAEIETLLSLLRQRSGADGPIVVLAEAYAAFQGSRYPEARRSYAQAREAFRALEPSPYRDIMMAHCTLNEAYSATGEAQYPIDLDALPSALATLARWQGERHPAYFRQVIKVARILGDERRYEQARRLLVSAMEKLGSDESSSFEILRARAELLRLDFEQNPEGDANEWSSTATEVGSMLDAIDTSLGLPQRPDVYRVREILLSAHSEAGDELRMARLLDQLWSDAERLGRVEDTCDYASQFLDRSDDEKNDPSEEIMEIEARLRTRCGCRAVPRPEYGRSTSNERNP